MSTTLVLCRHGQTDWNRDKRIMGQRDIPLNETGRRQAVELGERLRGQPLAAVIASDLSRARETAALAFPGEPIRLDARLREADFGEATGLTHQEYRAFDGGRWWQAVQENPAEVAHPGGESLGAVRNRMMAVLDEITEAYPDKTVAVVSHGAALEAATATLLGLTLHEAPQFHYMNATFRVLCREGDRWLLDPELCDV